MSKTPWMAAALVFALLFCAGCESPKPPPPREYILVSPYLGGRTLAVAPALNISGTRGFDPLIVSDHLFAELQQVQGLTVLPVNKTLAALDHLHMRGIDSATAAARVVDELGVDGILVPVVTLYDPYRPPVMGMTVQLYTGKHTDLGTLPEARQVNGALVAGDREPGLGADGAAEPVAQASAVFNANNQTTLKEIAEFAKGRTNYESALQEDRFLADMDAYTRFVCHAMVRRLIELERVRVAGR